METSELAELIKGRRSIRSWLEKPVNEDMLLQAIELATWAPNGGNQQNWLFYVILNKNVINSIADAVQARADYVASLPEASQIGENLTRRLKRSTSFEMHLRLSRLLPPRTNHRWIRFRLLGKRLTRRLNR